MSAAPSMPMLDIGIRHALTRWPNSCTTSSAVSASMVWVSVAITPMRISDFTTSPPRAAMRLASSWTVIASGMITSRTTRSAPERSRASSCCRRSRSRARRSEAIERLRSSSPSIAAWTSTRLPPRRSGPTFLTVVSTGFLAGIAVAAGAAGGGAARLVLLLGGAGAQRQLRARRRAGVAPGAAPGQPARPRPAPGRAHPARRCAEGRRDGPGRPLRSGGAMGGPAGGARGRAGLAPAWALPGPRPAAVRRHRRRGGGGFLGPCSAPRRRDGRIRGLGAGADASSSARRAASSASRRILLLAAARLLGGGADHERLALPLLALALRPRPGAAPPARAGARPARPGSAAGCRRARARGPAARWARAGLAGRGPPPAGHRRGRGRPPGVAPAASPTRFFTTST